MKSYLPQNTNNSLQSDNAAIRVYEFAQEIAPFVARSEFIDLLLDCRERTRTVMKKLKSLTPEKIQLGSPSELKDIVYLLTFTPQNPEAERLEAIEITIHIFKGLKEDLKDGFGYASFDITIAELGELAKQALIDLETDNDTTSPTGATITNITNITAVNSDLTVNYSGGKLTGQEIGELRKIILAAFPHEDELAQVLLFKLEMNWDAISSGGNYDVRVFNLITRVTEPQGMTKQLIKALSQARPRNQALTLWANS